MLDEASSNISSNETALLCPFATTQQVYELRYEKTRNQNGTIGDERNLTTILNNRKRRVSKCQASTFWCLDPCKRLDVLDPHIGSGRMGRDNNQRCSRAIAPVRRIYFIYFNINLLCMSCRLYILHNSSRIFFKKN